MLRLLMAFLGFFSIILYSIGQNPHQTSIEREGHLFVDSLLLTNGDSTLIEVEKIAFTGNKITHPSIIGREILFNTGDSLRINDLIVKAEQSRKNLLNISLFNFVDVSLDKSLDGNVIVTFGFVERWYIWPFPVFEIDERNFNEWWDNKNLQKANYGAYITWENFRGRREKLSLLARAGYNQRYGLAYQAPFINKRKTIGLTFSGGFSRSKEVNFLTSDNKQLFLKHPQMFLKQEWYLNLKASYRHGIFNSHALSLTMNNFHYADTILSLNPLFTPNGESDFSYFSLIYEFKSDHRDIKAYPLKGYYWDFSASRHGLDLLKNENINVLYFMANVRKYWEYNPNHHFALGSVIKYAPISKQPYFIQQGLGFQRNLVRGYEYYVIDGQSFVVLKSNYKYTLLPQRSGRLPVFRDKKYSLIHYALYINLFADMGYVHDSSFFENNPLSNTLLFGSGIGLDLVTFYDKVVRFEFSLNRNIEPGFYIHLIAPI